METARHDSADRIRIAHLTGIAKNHAGRKTGLGYDRDAAVAELLGELEGVDPELKPHLLAHATPGTRNWRYQTIKAMLVAAGADVGEVEEMAAGVDARMARVGFPVGELGESGPEERQDQGAS